MRTSSSTNCDVSSVENTLKGFHRDAISSLSFCPTESILENRHAREAHSRKRISSQLAGASLDGTISLWNFFCSSDSAESRSEGKNKLDPEARSIKLEGHTGPVHCLCYSPTGRLMASSSSDKTVRIWIPNANGDSMVLKGHSGPVRCVQFGNSKNGICNYWGDHSRMYQESETSSTLLITASDDKTAKIWSLPSKRFICSFSGHTNFVRAAKFSPDTCLAATGSDDKTMKLWDLQRGNGSNSSCLTTFFDYAARVNEVQFDPSKSYCLASGSADQQIRLYDIRSDSLIQLFTASPAGKATPFGDGGGVSSLSFHPSGNYLLSCSSSRSSSLENSYCIENNISIWDLREGRLLHSIPSAHVMRRNLYNHRSCTTTTSGCAAFSCNGSRFASGGVDNRILIWNTQLRGIVGGEDSDASSPPCISCHKQKASPHTAEEDGVARPHIHFSSTADFQFSANETLTKTVEHIVTQLDFVLKTLKILESRLSAQEEITKKLMKASKTSGSE